MRISVCDHSYNLLYVYSCFGLSFMVHWSDVCRNFIPIHGSGVQNHCIYDIKVLLQQQSCILDAVLFGSAPMVVESAELELGVRNIMTMMKK